MSALIALVAGLSVASTTWVVTLSASIVMIHLSIPRRLLSENPLELSVAQGSGVTTAAKAGSAAAPPVTATTSSNSALIWLQFPICFRRFLFPLHEMLTNVPRRHYLFSPLGPSVFSDVDNVCLKCCRSCTYAVSCFVPLCDSHLAPRRT